MKNEPVVSIDVTLFPSQVLVKYMDLDNWSGSNTEGYDVNLVDSLFPIKDAQSEGGWLQNVDLTNVMLAGVAVLFAAILSCVFMLLCKLQRSQSRANQDQAKFELATRVVAGRRTSKKGVEHDKLRYAVSRGLGNARWSSKPKNNVAHNVRRAGNLV